MAKIQHFKDKHVELERLTNRIETFLLENRFEVALYKDNNKRRFFIQARKTGTLRTVAGARRSTDITIEGSSDNFDVTIGTGEWGKNLLTSAPLFLVPAIGISATIVKLYTNKKFEDNLWKFVKDQINFLGQSKTIIPQTNSKKSTIKSEKQILHYDCDYVGGYPGWSHSITGGKMILERTINAHNRVIFESFDSSPSKKISIDASAITDANIISGKLGYHKNDKMIQIRCTNSHGKKIRPIFNISDDVIRGVLAGIDELAGESKALGELMHTKIDSKTKTCKKCQSDISYDSKFCFKCGQEQ